MENQKVSKISDPFSRRNSLILFTNIYLIPTNEKKKQFVDFSTSSNVSQTMAGRIINVK